MTGKRTETTQKNLTRFVEVYQTSASTAEAAEKLRVTPQHVMNRASRLRKLGVPLKRMPRVHEKPSPAFYKSLAATARKLSP